MMTSRGNGIEISRNEAVHEAVRVVGVPRHESDKVS